MTILLPIAWAAVVVLTVVVAYTAHEIRNKHEP